jgi:hypothetical protein
MSENQSEQLPRLVGYIQHLQVEDDPSGPVMVCRIKDVSSEAIENFFLRLINNRPIFEAQLNLLRDAIVHDKIRVRITYDPNNKLGPNASRIVAVRLQIYP